MLVNTTLGLRIAGTLVAFMDCSIEVERTGNEFFIERLGVEGIDTGRAYLLPGQKYTRGLAAIAIWMAAEDYLVANRINLLVDWEAEQRNYAAGPMSLREALERSIEIEEIGS